MFWGHGKLRFLICRDKNKRACRAGHGVGIRWRRGDGAFEAVAVLCLECHGSDMGVSISEN